MFGSFLMILGANLAIGALGIAFYVATVECVVATADGICPQGAFAVFFDFMGSELSVAFWIVLAMGLALLWRGWVVRRRN